MGRDSNGKRIQETKGGFLTKRDATEARRTRLTELRSRTADAFTVTVGEYLDLWLSRKRDLRAGSVRSYRYHIDKYLTPRLGTLRLVELERCPDHIDDVFSDLVVGISGKPLAPASVRRIHATLRNALNAAVHRRMLGFNPALGVELPSTEASGVQVWDAEQAGAFLDFVSADRLYAMYLLVLVAGMRRGETVGLRWQDVDLDNGELRIHRQVVEVGSQIHIGPPKTKAGLRPVALDQRTVTVLRAHRLAQQRDRLAWGEAWTDSGLVFTQEDGTMLRPSRVSRRFRTLAVAAGLPVIRFHDLRHTSATLALAAEVPMKVVSDRLGHSTTAITENLYVKVLPTVARAAAERIAGVVPHVRVVGDPSGEELAAAM